MHNEHDTDINTTPFCGSGRVGRGRKLPRVTKVLEYVTGMYYNIYNLSSIYTNVTMNLNP